MIPRVLCLAIGLSFSQLSCGDISSGLVVPGTPQPGQVPRAGQNVIYIASGAAGKGPAAYGVNPLPVGSGTTVVWVNQDTMAHTATSDTGIWDSGTLAPGQSFSFQFNDTGTFSYHCTIHGAASMSGAIQVQ